MNRPLMLVAGEASGDLHGARLLGELRRLRPGLRAFGLGGDELAREGLELLAHSRDVAVVGVFEVLRVLPRIRRAFRALVEQAAARKPRAAILIDFPDFNLRLAAALREQGIPIIYYISPQVWAWRKGRLRTLRQLVDSMLVLFPFERDLYEQHGIPVGLVGHPLVDEVPELPQVWTACDAVGATPGRLRIALLPGSRHSEVERLLPVMLEGSARLANDSRLGGKELELRLIRASTVSMRLLEEVVSRHRSRVEMVPSSERLATLADSHLALCASGTATLEAGLLGTPLIVLYRVGLGSELLGRLLLRMPYVSLVNLVLQQRVVPELLQRHANPAAIAKEAARLLVDDTARRAMQMALGGLRQRLGEAGASRRAACAVENVLRQLEDQGMARAEVEPCAR
jgi:lipid-A-disaccharide synthase